MIQELEYVLSKHVTDIPTTTESPTTPKPDKIIDNSEHLLIQAETKVEQLDIMLTTIKDEMNIICDLLNILKHTEHQDDISKIKQILAKHNGKLKNILNH